MAKRPSKKAAGKKKAAKKTGKKTSKKTSKKKGSKKAPRNHRKPDPMPPGPQRVFNMSLEDLEGLGKLQCTQAEVAAFFGCSRELVSLRLRTDEEALTAWKRGKADGKISLRRRIWRKAMKGDSALLRHLANNYVGLTEASTQRHAGHDGGPMPTGGGGLTTDQINDIKTNVLGIPPEKDEQ